MTSPSSMLVPYHCVRKEQHSTFDDSRTRSYLRGAWDKFAGSVTDSIILVICVHTRLFCDWKLEIKNLSRRSSWARYHVTFGKGGTEWDNTPHRFRTGWCCATATNQSILPRILDISDIYGWMIGPLWIYGYFHFSSGGAGDYRWNFIFFYFFISHSQHCLEICVPCC